MVIDSKLAPANDDGPADTGPWKQRPEKFDQ